MYTHAESKSVPVAPNQEPHSPKSEVEEAMLPFKDKRAETALQLDFHQKINDSPQVRQLKEVQEMADNHTSNQTIQLKGEAEDSSDSTTDAGNPGLIVGTQSIGDKQYVRYKAIKGTWVSASMVQQGYDKLYGTDTAYGAYTGIVLSLNGKPLQNPDKIYPGQEYLIPQQSQQIEFEEQEVIGRRTPKISYGDQWQENPVKTWVKDQIMRPTDHLPYHSFELTGPEPPSRNPRDAVAYWLKIHQNEIVSAESTWNISRIAIAGIIAWEALENPQAWTVSSFGPGKMHHQGDWPKEIEKTYLGKVKHDLVRKVEFMDPAKKNPLSINYIGAALDIVSKDAENAGWNIRNNPEILAQIYHGSTPSSWKKKIKSKPANESFKIVEGMMGAWVLDNYGYLEDAVGKADKF